MAYSAMQVANTFIRKANEHKVDNLTPMKLQKLMFFAQSWYLKKFQTRLIDDVFYRWDYGPVIPSIYYAFAHNSGCPIEESTKDASGTDISSHLSPFDEKFIDDVIAEYGKYSGWVLSMMTHESGTAWSNGTHGTLMTDVELYNGRV